MTLININTASELLNKNKCLFYLSNNILNKFTVKKGKKEVLFNLTKYNKYISLKDSITALNTLFIEYLVNECNYSYHKLSTIVNIGSAALREHRLGVQSAIKIMNYFKDKEEYKKFNQFYDFKGNYTLDNLIEELKKLEKELE